jgi:hypothetical protein
VAGLKDEDYKDFKVIPAHLMMAVIKLPGADPKMLALPPSVSCPAIAEGGDQTKQQIDSTAAASQEKKAKEQHAIAAAVLQNSSFPYFMRGSTAC